MKKNTYSRIHKSKKRQLIIQAFRFGSEYIFPPDPSATNSIKNAEMRIPKNFKLFFVFRESSSFVVVYDSD